MSNRSMETKSKIDMGAQCSNQAGYTCQQKDESMYSCARMNLFIKKKKKN